MRLSAVLFPLALLACARGPLVGPRAAVDGSLYRFPAGRPEVEAGYDAYYEALAPYGTWLPDPSYGVRFCPRLAEGATYRPFVDRGRWAGAPEAAAGAPTGADSPYWIAEDDGFGPITTHHGWWVEDRAEKRFCWIPGTRETNARVVWREGNGFVGWAPEPPAWVDDGGDGGLSWVYTFLGTLFDANLTASCLCDASTDSYETVAALAYDPIRAKRDSDGRATAGRSARRQGPRAGDVGTARQALVGWAGSAGASARPAAGDVPRSPPPSSPSGGGSGASDTGTSKKSEKIVVVVEQDLRPSLLLPLLLAAPPPGPFVPNVHAIPAPALVERDRGAPSSASAVSVPPSGGGASSPFVGGGGGGGGRVSAASAAPTNTSTNHSSSGKSSSSSSSSTSKSYSTSTTVAPGGLRPTVSVGR